MIFSLLLTFIGCAAMIVAVLGWYMRDNGYDDNILTEARWPATIVLCTLLLMLMWLLEWA